MSMDVHPRKLVGVSLRKWKQLQVPVRRSEPKPPPTPSKRQRRRRAWLAGKTQECRVGVEKIYGDDMLVTRTKRKPPMWLIEKYLDDGTKAHLLLSKTAPGERHTYRWSLMGKDYISMHPTRRDALRTAAQLEPVLEEEKDDE